MFDETKINARSAILRSLVELFSLNIFLLFNLFLLYFFHFFHVSGRAKLRINIVYNIPEGNVVWFKMNVEVEV